MILSDMLKPKLKNSYVIAQLSNMCTKKSRITGCAALVSGLSFIPLFLAGKYKKYPNYNDILQVGYETLWKTLIDFDVTKSSNFTGCAFFWIRQKMAREASKELILSKNWDLKGLVVPDMQDGDLESEILHHEEKELAKALLDQLPSEYRDIIFYIYDENTSLRDVGAKMSLSHETVRRMAQDAISTMRKNTQNILLINT